MQQFSYLLKLSILHFCQISERMIIFAKLYVETNIFWGFPFQLHDFCIHLLNCTVLQSIILLLDKNMLCRVKYQIIIVLIQIEFLNRE